MRRVLASMALTLASIAVSHSSSPALASTSEVSPGCYFGPKTPYWAKCWATPYSTIYTQAQIRTLEQNETYGWHLNFQLQPSGQAYTDYYNFHIYFDGVANVNQTSLYAWRVYCEGTSGYGRCSADNWNGASGLGKYFYSSTAACQSTDHYACAQIAAGDFKDCFYYTCSTSTFIQANFPGLDTAVLQKDSYGDGGTLQNAFCSVMNTTQFSCSTR